MLKNLFTIILTWIFTFEAVFAFTPAIAKKHIPSKQQYFAHAMAQYNSFALNPKKATLPAGFTSETSSAIYQYMAKNNINGPLPLAKLNSKGKFELKMEGQNFVLELDPIVGTLRIKGQTLILKSTDSLKTRLERIEEFLTAPKAASNFDHYFSFIMDSANADCLEKYDRAISDKMPKREGVYLLPQPAFWTMAAGLLMSFLLMPAAIAVVPEWAGFFYAFHVQDVDRDIRSEEYRVENEITDMISIEGALRIAKTGKVPEEPSVMKRPYNEDEFRFEHLYYQYSDLVKKSNSNPMSKEDFLKTLAEGDAKEKFCGQKLIDTAQKLTDNITIQKPIDPNSINKMSVAPASVIDDSRKDMPKEVPVSAEPSANSGVSSATSK